MNEYTNTLETLRDRLYWQFEQARMVLDWMNRTVQLGPEAEQRRHHYLNIVSAVNTVQHEITICRWGELH